MRSVVVLPAPLGPSSPVISPSRASKRTPSTARTTPLFVLKLLCRSLAMIMGKPACGDWSFGKAGTRRLRRNSGLRQSRRSRLPSVVSGERRDVADRIEATRVQRPGVQRLDELPDELGHAADAADVVALAPQHQMATVGQALRARAARTVAASPDRSRPTSAAPARSSATDASKSAGRSPRGQWRHAAKNAGAISAPSTVAASAGSGR